MSEPGAPQIERQLRDMSVITLVYGVGTCTGYMAMSPIYDWPSRRDSRCNRKSLLSRVRQVRLPDCPGHDAPPR
ncbi:hypothetical protein BR93DRAFT_928456 [Coniochaeta sp. PMI_546]|nr:hypothetical protein BR93DRAFT_928456 [Coniochaeta sp. PMI_546]